MPFSTQLTADREYSDVPITLSTNIVDISNVGLKQFWNLKGHMQAASQLATAHYPETLDRIFIIGAPIFFSTVWAWVKRWFDPITVSKIFVLSAAEVRPTLEAFIEPRNIPKKYGGELDFSFGSLSIPDPNWDGILRWEGDFKEFPTGPLLWEDDPNDPERLLCIRFGSTDGKANREVVCSIPKNFVLPTSMGSAAAAADAATATASTNVVVEKDGVDDATQTTGTDPKAIPNEAVTNGEKLGELKITDEKAKSTAATTTA